MFECVCDFDEMAFANDDEGGIWTSHNQWPYSVHKGGWPIPQSLKMTNLYISNDLRYRRQD